MHCLTLHGSDRGWEGTYNCNTNLQDAILKVSQISTTKMTLKRDINIFGLMGNTIIGNVGSIRPLL